MCGRYTETAELEDLRERFGFSVPETRLTPRFNIAPGQYAPVVVYENGERVLKMMRWGLVPFWAKDLKIAYKTINARAESLHERASYKHALKRRRCLVLADGFYEWKKTPQGKVPHYIFLKGNNAFSFAGLWEKWDRSDAADGEPGTKSNPLFTFTIVTTVPYDFMKPVHDRMPVILTPDSEAKWLDGSFPHDELRCLLGSYDGNEMDAYEVNDDVNSSRNDHPSLTDEAGNQQLELE